jgi:hypothetical protein
MLQFNRMRAFRVSLEDGNTIQLSVVIFILALVYQQLIGWL